MAWKLKYRCKACGYEAEVYEGRGLFRQQKNRSEILALQASQGPSGPSVFAVWQRQHQNMERKNLPKVSGRNVRYGRKGVLDVSRIMKKKRQWFRCYKQSLHKFSAKRMTQCFELRI